MHLSWTFGTFLGHMDNSEDFLISVRHSDCLPSPFRPFSPVIGSSKNKTMIRLKWAFWDISRHFWTTWDIVRHFNTFWDNSEDFLTGLDHLDCFASHFRPFSSIIGSFKKTAWRTDRPSYRDAWTHLKNKFVIASLLGSITFILSSLKTSPFGQRCVWSGHFGTFKGHFGTFQKKAWRTDIPSNRDAWTHLKTRSVRTYRRMDGPTDGQTLL